MKNITCLKIVIITLTLSCHLNFFSVLGQTSEAQSSYNIATNSIENLFSHILDLSKSNQDISIFVKGMNKALKELQLAETAISESKYTESITHSREANQLAIELISEIAEKSPQRILFNTASDQKELFQTVIVTVVFFLLWNQITTRYNKKILNSLPEVTIIES